MADPTDTPFVVQVFQSVRSRLWPRPQPPGAAGKPSGPAGPPNRKIAKPAARAENRSVRRAA